MAVAIKVENLSKAYQLGNIGTGSLSNDLNRWYAKVRGKEDPFLKIGETNDRTTKGTSNVVWSLKDINFEIKEGDAVGIIGRNGAGKSTLLKLLSRVTAPTTGSFKVKGRIASLLEVGTGFHPELSGRENIYLNGAILGMRKREITRKFEEIADFSGVERYIDTPVKRYSSGMYVRLAFAVAAHLESEILIVDEVLAVGDAEFQKKCLGKMGAISTGEGRTILFVSHNMNAVKELCNKGILLKNGEIAKNGDINLITDSYMNSFESKAFYLKQVSESGNERINGEFTSIRFFNEQGNETNNFLSGSKPYIELQYELFENHNNFNVGMQVTDLLETHIYSTADTDLHNNLLSRKKGIYKTRVRLEIYNLNSGTYKIKMLMGIINTTLFDRVELTFTVENKNFLNTGIRSGLLMSLNEWKYTN